MFHCDAEHMSLYCSLKLSAWYKMLRKHISFYQLWYILHTKCYCLSYNYKSFFFNYSFKGDLDYRTHLHYWASNHSARKYMNFVREIMTQVEETAQDRATFYCTS